MGVHVALLPQVLFWVLCSLSDHSANLSISLFGFPVSQLHLETEGCLCLEVTMMNMGISVQTPCQVSYSAGISFRLFLNDRQ